jgi:hypothetical protein
MPVQTTGHRQHHPGFNRVMLAVLHSPMHRLVSRRLCELRYHAPSDGRVVRLPVGYVRRGAEIIVLVANAQAKRWWRAFTPPRVVEVRQGPVTWTGVGHVIHPHHPASTSAREAYERASRVRIASTDLLVRIEPLRDSQPDKE